MSLSLASLRATSPFAAATAYQTAASGSGPDDTNSRLMLLQSASGIEELIALVPDDYRSVLAPPLRNYSGNVDKWVNGRATLARWLSHKAAGTFPTHIHCKLPAVQMTKDFDSSKEGQDARRALEAARNQFLTASLDASIKAKTDEVGFLERAITVETFFMKVQPIIAARRDELKAGAKLPSIEDGMLVGWTENPMVEVIGDRVLSDVCAWAHRIRSIIEGRADASAEKSRKKRELRQAAVDMALDENPSQSIQSMVDKAVNARFKKSEKPRKVMAGRSKKVPEVRFYVPPPSRFLPNPIKSQKRPKTYSGRNAGTRPSQSKNVAGPSTKKPKGKGPKKQNGRTGKRTGGKSSGKRGNVSK